MSPLSLHTTGREGPVWVALDLETTGLSPETDAIIEIGAVKFREGEVLDTFSTLVAPSRPLPPAIQALTGIAPADLERAPAFSAVRDDLEAFLGGLPLIGHSIGFDLGFLRRAGVAHPGSAYDTLDLAAVLLPSQPGYSLAAVAQALGVAQPEAHRAAADAETAMKLFLRLLDLLRALPSSVLAELRRIAGRSDWSLRHLFRELALGEAPLAAGEPGLEGVDLPALARRLRTAPQLRPGGQRVTVDQESVPRLLAAGGPLASTLFSYEQRPEQLQMAGAVTQVLNDGGRLTVEAGTGTGKSLAYLLPALLFAQRNAERIVVSTNTINLQEQLVTKDIPDAVRAIEASGEGAGVRFALLKGRANYLCLRRWAAMKQSEQLTAAEARVLAKVLVWLQQTSTGDRGEINLAGPEVGPWGRLSAEGFDSATGPCPFARRGLCFYSAARRRAEAAHLVVVNHALLALDAGGGGLLPDYDHLIIDEAHHLEEVVTGQWGFTVDEDALAGALSRVAGSGAPSSNILAPLGAVARSALTVEQRRRDLLGAIQQAQEAAQRAMARVSALFRLLADFTMKHRPKAGGSDSGGSLRVTRSIRAQPAWSQVEIAWEEVNLLLGQVQERLERLDTLAGQCADSELADREGYRLDLLALAQEVADLRTGLKEAVAAPDEKQVYWISLSVKDGSAILHAAPLDVGPALEARLFSQKKTVVLTSATLSVEGNLQYVRERLHLQTSRELVLGSPFDYPRQVLLYVPDDVPPPDSPGQHQAIARIVADAARAARGRTMVLFTGWAALRAARAQLQELLAADGLTLLAQGADGPPQQLVDHFRRASNAVLLGTRSLWEGVDIAGDALSVLMITRLPFSVPTDPVFAARSEQLDDPFNLYAVPEAVLRFKQGFGRLVRRRTDRGVLVVLDRRVLSKAYGAVFLTSIPRCTVKVGPAASLAHETVRWLGQQPLTACP